MIIFVADAFIEHYVGGAELTSEALIDSSLLPCKKVLSSYINEKIMTENKNAFWIFGNFQNLSNSCKVYAIKNLNYSVLEYDYKFCKYRSPEKHIKKAGYCDCSSTIAGKLNSTFIARSKINWWMSEAQKQTYTQQFSFIKGKVLSSVFSKKTLDLIQSLDTNKKNNTWLILNSKSWIKGVDDAIEYAKSNNLKYELVWGLGYEDLLKKLAVSKGLIFLPKAGDTFPRLVIEAKLLGCELILNNNVQHKNEEWFTDRKTCLDYLRSRTRVFWSEVEKYINFIPSENSLDGPKYHIISPFYNAERYIERCIKSIKAQKYNNFQCILIDDLSTDNSLQVAQTAIDNDPRFTIVKKTEKCYALKNISEAIDSSKAEKEDVIILLDGDDWFASGLTLDHLNECYNDNDCWMTYGSYVMYPHGIRGVEPSAYPDEVVKSNTYRQDKWRASHLRTFRKKVWDNIDKKDLKDNQGNFYKMAYDQAIMLPLIEMSGDRCKYLDKILHIYNKENPLNVDKIKALEQIKAANEIRSKKPYERLA